MNLICNQKKRKSLRKLICLCHREALKLILFWILHQCKNNQAIYFQNRSLNRILLNSLLQRPIIYSALNHNFLFLLKIQIKMLINLLKEKQLLEVKWILIFLLLINLIFSQNPLQGYFFKSLKHQQAIYS